MPKMTGAQALTKTIMAHDVDTIFALPGVQLDPLFDAFYHEQDSLRIVHTRHEQGTSYMALGYAQSTGKTGVCTVVPGPGVYNAGAGLCTAHGQGAPVLCVAGQIPSRMIDKDFGMLHEIQDQMGTMAAVTKWQGRANSPKEAPGVIVEAFQQMHTGRKRPVFVEMSPDIMSAEDDIEIPVPNTDYPMIEADPDLIEKAAALLGSAENPAIYVGGGIVGAEEELLALAERLEAPVYMTENAVGSMPWDHHLAQNYIGAAHTWPKVDVALAVGTRFEKQIMSWGRDENVKLIRIDPDPKQSIEQWPPDVQIVAHGKTGLRDLAERVERHNRKRESRKDEFEALKAATIKELAETLPPQHAYGTAIQNALPDDGIACFGVTQLGFYSWYGFPTSKPRQRIEPGLQGTLGYSFPTALGAQVGNPDKKVICVTGDGGFMFGASELATAMRHRINLVTLVFNDGHFGNVKRNQKLGYDERYIASDLHNPDFVKLAESYGAMGLRAESPEALGKAMDEAFKADMPVVIDVPVGEFPNWAALQYRRKLRG